MSFGLGLSSLAELNTDGVQKLDFRPISREILETEKVVRQLLSLLSWPNLNDCRGHGQSRT